MQNMDKAVEAFLYPHGLQGGNRIVLAKKFAKNGIITNLFGGFHISHNDMTFAAALLKEKIDELMETAEKVHLVMVGFSPLTALMYGWYLKHSSEYNGRLDTVYFLEDDGETWVQYLLPDDV